ncbi:hypothetical protein CR513_51541, partial [Mucuna pruriens]
MVLEKGSNPNLDKSRLISHTDSSYTVICSFFFIVRIGLPYLLLVSDVTSKTLVATPIKARLVSVNLPGLVEPTPTLHSRVRQKKDSTSNFRTKDYIDLVAVDTFLAKKDRGENPVIVVLANTYYTLNYYYGKNGKGLRCCTPLLYLWMTAYLFHNKRRTAYPIKDHHWSWIKSMSRTKWTRCFDDSSKRTIR